MVVDVAIFPAQSETEKVYTLDWRQPFVDTCPAEAVIFPPSVQLSDHDVERVGQSILQPCKV